jgi:beta-phosphoglucomutase-like phosphatase (HAD superfamily)
LSKLNDKIILTDCDGVLLNWEYAFGIWMEDHGYTMVENGNFIYNVAKRYGIERSEGSKLTRFFNESAVQGFLPALRDAEHYVRLLANLGYKFHVITSMTKDPNAQKLRTRNLKKLFGEDTFEKFIYLDTGEDKDGVLSAYEGTNYYWIEDKPTNAEAGLKFGLRSLVIEHAFNLHYDGEAPFVKNWKEIYETITGHEEKHTRWV